MYTCIPNSYTSMWWIVSTKRSQKRYVPHSPKKKNTGSDETRLTPNHHPSRARTYQGGKHINSGCISNLSPGLSILLLAEQLKQRHCDMVWYVHAHVGLHKRMASTCFTSIWYVSTYILHIHIYFPPPNRFTMDYVIRRTACIRVTYVWSRMTK